MTMQLVGWAIVHSLWQGGVIALVAACLFALARDMKASTRYTIGLVGLLLMIVLPILTAINSARSRTHATISPTPSWSVTSTTPSTNRVPASLNVSDVNPTQPSISSVTSETRSLGVSVAPIASELGESTGIATTIDAFILRYFETALPWLALAWVFGLLISSAQLIGGLSRTRRITRVGASPADDALSSRVRELADRLGISRAVRVLKSVSVDVPLVVGALRPVIVIPASLLTGLTPLQLDMLLTHELAHVRRYDFLVNLIQTVVETLLFYHPAARWLSDRVREERENCCDDIAVSVCGGDASGYTETLLALEESRAGGFGLAAAATGGSLLRRAHRLITGRTPHVELGPRWIAGVITIAAALFTGSEAMGRGIESSFAPLPGIDVTEDKDSTDKRRGLPDPSRAGPASVAKSPAKGTLDDRWKWAESHGRALGTYWIGYLIAGDPDAKWRYYADDLPVRIGRSTMSGRMMLGDGDLSEFTFSGVALDPLVGPHARKSTAVFILVSDGVVGKRVQRVHVGTYELPMYFDRRPLIWLDSASDAESLGMIRILMARARDADMRRNLVATVGVHQDRAIVVPILIDILQSSSEVEGSRREAAEWLGRKGDGRAIAALSRAARNDRAKGVREESIEAFEHMPAAAATDSLISFASTLDDYDYRRTAIEALGQREDSKALEYLARVVRTPGYSQLKLDALEAISDMPDGRGFQTVLNFARNDQDPDIRRKAVESIAESEPPSRALDVLAQVVRNDSDESVRREAAESIAEVHDARSVKILLEIVNDSGSGTGLQMEAVESLGEIEDDENALKALADIVMRHPGAHVRAKAVETLGDFDNEVAALKILKSVIEKEKDLGVRLKAVEALAELNDDAGMPWLRELAKSSPDPAVRAKAREALDDQ